MFKASIWFRWGWHLWSPWPHSLALSPPPKWAWPISEEQLIPLKFRETKELWDLKWTVVWRLKSTSWRGRYPVFQLIACSAQKPSKPFHSINPEDGLALGMLFCHTSVTLLEGKSHTLPQLPFLHASDMMRPLLRDRCVEGGGLPGCLRSCTSMGMETKSSWKLTTACTLVLKSIIFFLNYTCSVLKTYKNH